MSKRAIISMRPVYSLFVPQYLVLTHSHPQPKRVNKMSSKKKTNKKSSKKPVVVDRKFLNDLANEIYDTKTRKFLRLCDGALQNGPDPTDEERPMHCGLGELYYAMTGNQPEDDEVNEDDVVDIAVERSTVERKKENAISTIRALKLPEFLENNLLNKLESSDIDDDFRDTLAHIPDVNDGDCASMNAYDVYRSRASRVAKQLRLAASFLPE